MTGNLHFNKSESVPNFITKVSKLSGPPPEIKDNIKNLELSIENSNWEEGLHLSNIILDVDQNNIDACKGKILSLTGLNKFKEAKDFISILSNKRYQL